MHALPPFVRSSRISPAPRKAQRSASTCNDSQEFFALKLPTGIVLEDLIISKLPQALPFWLLWVGGGASSRRRHATQTGAAWLLHAE